MLPVGLFLQFLMVIVVGLSSMKPIRSDIHLYIPDYLSLLRGVVVLFFVVQFLSAS